MGAEKMAEESKNNRARREGIFDTYPDEKWTIIKRWKYFLPDWLQYLGLLIATRSNCVCGQNWLDSESGLIRFNPGLIRFNPSLIQFNPRLISNLFPQL